MKIYLDNAASTKVCKVAINSLMESFSNNYGNPSSLHRNGIILEKIINQSQKNISNYLVANEYNLIFTSSATESNNIAILGAAYATRKRSIITTSIEHASIQNILNFLKSSGYNIICISPNKDGNFSPDQFTKHITEDTFLVSVMHVNNETGTILPIEQISKAIKSIDNKIIFHTDAVQSFCKLQNINLNQSCIDMYTFSGHKIYTPKGIAGLFIKKNIRINPIIFGGGQQYNLRPGTEHFELIKCLSDTVRYLQNSLSDRYAHFQTLYEFLIKQIQFIPEIKINNLGNTVPYIVNLSIQGIKSEIMLNFLSSHNIYISASSACSKKKLSHVLSSYNINDNTIDCSIRISFSHNTQIKHIEKLIIKLNEAIKIL